MARGGSRPGAGRKSSGLTQRVMIRLSVETLDIIRAQAEANGLNISEIIRKNIEENTMEKMFMNPFTGSVAPEPEWREDFAAIAPEDRPVVWGGDTFESAGLIPVVWDTDAQDWREAE